MYHASQIMLLNNVIGIIKRRTGIPDPISKISPVAVKIIIDCSPQLRLAQII